MTRHVVLLMKKLKGPSIVLASAKHNLRALPPAENINADRSTDNVILRGPGEPHEVAALAQSLISRAGLKSLRTDAVRALEIIVSLPPASGVDEQSFFAAAVEWADRYLGVPVLSAIVHNDEAAPHLHVVLLPLIADRMIGSEMMGGFGRWQAIQADFYNRVAAPFGLTRPPRQARASAANRRDTARSRLADIKQRHGLVIASEAEAELLDLIAGDATKAMRKGPSAFVRIMTKPVEPEATRVRPGSTRGSTRVSLIVGQEIGRKTEHRNDVTNSANPSLCKGSASPPPAKTDAAGEVRECDDDMPVDRWNAEIGRMVRPLPQASRRLLASASVRAILDRHQEHETHLKRVQHVAGALRGGP